MKYLAVQPLLVAMLLVIAFAALCCGDTNTVNSTKADEITWQQTALDSLNILSLAANSSGDVFAASCGSDIFRTRDQGTTWLSVRGPTCFNSLAINADGDIFGVRGCCLLRSTDNGESWTSLLVSGGLDLGPIAFNPSGEVFVGSRTSDESVGGIYRSSDNGDSWMQTGFPDSIGAVALAINSKGDIFSGTGFGVYRSTDNGETWVQINTGFEGLGGNPIVEALAINPVKEDIFAAIFGAGVYHSTNNADTWTFTGLTTPGIQSIVINAEGNIFSASGGFTFEPEGIFYSPDNGDTWTKINNGLTNTNVFSLTVDSSGFLYAGTWSSGVFRSVKSTIQ